MIHGVLYKKIISLGTGGAFLGVLLSSVSVFSIDLSIYGERDFISHMVRIRQFPLILKARVTDPEKESDALQARWEILFLNTRTPYFPRLLHTFPGEEDFVLKALNQDPRLYMRMYDTLTQGFVHPLVTNVLTGHVSLAQGDREFFGHEDVGGKLKVAPFPHAGLFFWYTSCLTTTTPPSDVDMTFLTKFLALGCAAPIPPDQKLGLPHAVLAQQVPPVVLGDIYFSQREYEQACVQYSRAIELQTSSTQRFSNYGPRRLLHTNMRLYFGDEAEKALRTSLLEQAHKNPDESEKVYTELTSVQLMLHGCMYPSTTLPEKRNRVTQARKLLRKMSSNEGISHLTAMMLSDIALGFYGMPFQDLHQARLLLSEALENESIPVIKDLFRTRLAELKLALYSEGEPDVQGALEFLRNNPYATELLYGVYIGFFGSQATNLDLANHLVEDNLNLVFFRLQSAVQCLREKDYESAVASLEPIHLPAAEYLLARIHSDPKSHRFYQPDRALALLVPLANRDYRDARALFLRMILKEQFPGKTFQLPEVKLLLATCTWTPDSIFNCLRKCFQHSPTTEETSSPSSRLSTDASPPVGPLEEDLDKTAASSVSPLEPVVKEEGLEPGIDEEGDREAEAQNILLLLDGEEDGGFNVLHPAIEEFLARLQESAWSWRKLNPHLERLGAHWSHDRKQIKFEGVEGVFTLHPSHNGRDRFTFKGYYRNLLGMILQRVEFMRRHSDPSQENLG